MPVTRKDFWVMLYLIVFGISFHKFVVQEICPEEKEKAYNFLRWPDIKTDAFKSIQNFCGV